jgi:hypothetical protein
MEREPGSIADAFRAAIYGDDPKDQYMGLSRNEFCDFVYSGDLAWAPDGDEAFDDGSYVLQFDVGDRVRLISFRRGEEWPYDPETLRDLWISADEYYGILQEWRDAFQVEWAALPTKQI